MSTIIPESVYHPRRYTNVPATMVLHSNGAQRSVASLYRYIIDHNAHIYPHYQVAWDGSIEQYCPTDKQAYHAYNANLYAIGVETQDSGYGTRPIDTDPWSIEQLYAMAGLALLHGIAAEQCVTPWSGGLGYHAQFRAEWNHEGHSCPGRARISQIPRIVSIMNPGGEDMPAKLVRKTSTGAIEVYSSGLALPFRFTDPNDAVRNLNTIHRLTGKGLMVEPWIELDDDEFDCLPRLKG